MTRRNSTRRSFLRAVGSAFAAVPASVPLYRLLEGHVAKAYGETLPLRFVGIYHPHGVAAEHFVMRSTDTATTFDLKFANSSLTPFDDAATYGKSFKDRLLLIEGLAGALITMTEWWRLSHIGISSGLMAGGFLLPFAKNISAGVPVGGTFLLGSLLSAAILYQQVRNHEAIHSLKRP